MLREKVTKLLNQALDKNPTLFLIDLKVSTDNKIQVILDGDKGVTVEDCMAVSRAIEHNLDREDTDFSLDVMSAGLSEPLKLPRQFHKNIGRDLVVRTQDDEETTGTLIAVEEQNICLQYKTREPKPVGKGKTTVTKQVNIPMEQIAKATVKIKF